MDDLRWQWRRITRTDTMLKAAVGIVKKSIEHLPHDFLGKSAEFSAVSGLADIYGAKVFDARLLEALGSHPFLNGKLALKGGTALPLTCNNVFKGNHFLSGRR